MKERLLQQLLETDNEIQQILDKQRQQKQQYKDNVERLRPQILQSQQKMKQLSTEPIPEFNPVDYENLNFLLLHNLQSTLKFTQCIEDSRNLQQSIQMQLQQGKFREAVKQFVHVYQLDDFLHQKALELHKPALNMIIQTAADSCALEEDYFSRVRKPEYIVHLFSHQSEQDQFSSCFSSFLASIQPKSMMSSDFTRQFSQLTQTALSHFNLLLETLFKYQEDIITYYLAQMFNISLSNFQQKQIDSYINECFNSMKNFIFNYINQNGEVELDFKNTFANALQITVTLVYRFYSLIKVQTNQFNTSSDVLRNNLNLKDLFSNRFEALVQNEQFKPLLKQIVEKYKEAENDYLCQNLIALQKQYMPGNEFFQLFKHVTTRVDQLDISSEFIDKIEFKKELAVYFEQHFLVFEDQINELLTIYQVYSKIGSLHGIMNTDKIYELYQNKLTKQLQSKIKEFVAEKLTQQIQRLVASQNAGALIEYMEFLLLEQDLDDQEQQMAQMLTAPYLDKATQLLIKQIEVNFIQQLIKTRTVISAMDTQNLSKQINTLIQFFTKHLHRSCVEEFKAFREIVCVLGSSSRQEANEIGVGLGTDIVGQICQLQGIV
ncbi:Hypothetical_protein [Hexamita inflata]|uniref:Hypothetical_protein n=1 Tax=Hexamita inflata TaxID=28002 RepID=A0ABP1HE04_9EUKA